MITRPSLPDPACRAWYARLIESRKSDIERQMAFWNRYATRSKP